MYCFVRNLIFNPPMTAVCYIHPIDMAFYLPYNGPALVFGGSRSTTSRHSDLSASSKSDAKTSRLSLII